jgi:hypothetical protein
LQHLLSTHLAQDDLLGSLFAAVCDLLGLAEHEKESNGNRPELEECWRKVFVLVFPLFEAVQVHLNPCEIFRPSTAYFR